MDAPRILGISMRSFLIIIVFVFFTSSAHALPSFEEIKASYKKSDAVLLDRHGAVIHELRVDPKGRRLDWASLRDISPTLIKAVIASEDKRFYEHSGVDWKALGAATLNNLLSGGLRPWGSVI